MSRALIIGIDEYDNLGSLSQACNDARKFSEAIRHNTFSDEPTRNFTIKSLGFDANLSANLKNISDGIDWLVASDTDIALLYFAGHGIVEPDVGVSILAPKDATSHAPGIRFEDLMRRLSNSNSNIISKIIILDCCHSGSLGNHSGLGGAGDIATLPKGFTILTASQEGQLAREDDEGGVFTNCLLSGLHGAAADIRGRVTPASLYSHIDQLMAPLAQRPIYKANVQSFVQLKRVAPVIKDSVLIKFTDWFKEEDEYKYKLGPECEPNRDFYKERYTEVDVIPSKAKIYKNLQDCARAGLVKPTGWNSHEKREILHMWEAAMEQQYCELTTLGLHYRKLVTLDLIP